LNVARHPGWIWRTLVAGGLPNFDNLLEFVDVKNPTMFDVSRWTPTHDPRLTWTSIAEIRKQWPRPLILKGILRTDDVRRAIDAGVDGVVLSNHGGRQAEPTISPLEILVPTRRAVGLDYPLIVDSGFRRGVEVAIALALGASAVMLGRSLLYGLAAKGKPGVAAAIEIMRSELDRTLALIGVPAVRTLSSDALSTLPA
jgi:(S)-mandelate dehydrogenase